MAYGRIGVIVSGVIAASLCFSAVSATLFPERVPELESISLLFPNEEESVTDCLYSIYGYGGIGLASSIFSDRYVDKTYSHTVRVRLGATTCVGLIVNENHILTSSDCASAEEELLPEVKLNNETVDAITVLKLFPHPNYNLTLLRLSTSIEFTHLAVPVCFWDDMFDDGFEKIQSISTAPNGNLTLDETVCSFQNRKDCLKDLLLKSTMLQTRAIAHYHMHPFVLTFGTDEDGNTLPVSKYIGWIETVTEMNITSSECVSKYNDLREYEDSMVSRSDNYQSVQYSKSRLSITSVDQYKVRILPNTAETGSKRHCYGSLIGPQFILTAANCLKQYVDVNFSVEMAQLNVYYPMRDNKIRVRTNARKVHYHPEYDASTFANDIALLELMTPIYHFNKTVLPACIWSRDKLPVSEFQSNGYVPYNETIDDSVRTDQLYATADVYDDCVEKVPQHKICAGFPTALVPRLCHNSIGSALSRSLFAFNRYFEFIFAINSQGENCGFNLPTVYTKIAPYIPWIDSIMFAPKVHYEDDTKYYGDRCQDASGAEGTCVSLQNCPRLDQAVKKGGAINSFGTCSFGKHTETVVCCSEENMLLDEDHRDVVAQVSEELEMCHLLYHEYRRNKSPYQVDNFPTYPYLIRIEDNENRTCNGTLVSKQFVLTTATCYQKLAHDEAMIVAGNSTKQKRNVLGAFVHPEFGGVPVEYNLMLLKLDSEVKINNETIPACLWQNQTHTPLRLEEAFAKPHYKHQYRFPLFNRHCQLKYPKCNVTNLNLCVEKDNMYYHHDIHIDTDGGNPLVWHVAEGVEECKITYMVGLFGSGHSVENINDDNNDGDDYGAHPSRLYYTVYQRISEHYNWIKNVITVEMQNNDNIEFTTEQGL